MNPITPFLWFNDEAEAAAQFYISVFKNSKIISSSHYPENQPNPSGRPPGSVMVVEFEINGQRFLALNGGEHFTITPAVSFVIPCDDQEEIDYYWKNLSAVPEAEQCGWICDKYGVSWQVVPASMQKIMSSGDATTQNRKFQAIMRMKKIDLELLKSI